MNEKECFMNCVGELFNNNDIPDEAKAYFEKLKLTSSPAKSKFTENGKNIILFLQSSEKAAYKAKEIADEMEISSRSVSGACRKLVTDGFIEKIGKDPIVYSLTSLGKDINVNEEE